MSTYLYAISRLCRKRPCAEFYILCWKYSKDMMGFFLEPIQYVLGNGNGNDWLDLNEFSLFVCLLTNLEI